MTDSEPNEIDATPRASALIESLRSFGYSPATAIADLVDNSISANAQTIDVQFNWAGPDSTMRLTDDGDGMSPQQLTEAMRPGSSNPLDSREDNDLGRFGLGLKTASFSQARSLTVASRHGLTEPAASRCWDLDYVQRTDKWVVLTDNPRGRELETLLDGSTGTVVAWHELDRIVDDRPATDARARKSFLAMVHDVRLHLEAVFHRFIENGLHIRVNGAECQPWDPFLEGDGNTEVLQNEKLELLSPAGATRQIDIQPFILPHRSRLDASTHKRAGGQKGWNLQQGFYLYRRERLIVAGDWFDRGTKPEEHHKLARIRVEFDQDLDSLWALDVRKAKARPPASLKDDFVRIARATRKRAEEVYRSRGRKSVGPAPRKGHRVPVWSADTSGTSVKYVINREHPLLAATTAEPSTASVIGLLKLIESTVPVDHILSQGFRDERLIDSTPGSDEELRAMAVELFCALVRAGRSESDAKLIVNEAQPFDQEASFIQTLDGSRCK